MSTILLAHVPITKTCGAYSASAIHVLFSDAPKAPLALHDHLSQLATSLADQIHMGRLCCGGFASTSLTKIPLLPWGLESVAFLAENSLELFPRLVR